MKGWLKRLDDWTNMHRPWALLGVVALTVATVAAFDRATDFYLFKSLFYPARATPADVRYWSALVYGVAFAMGLPVAFLLWHWRDRNVRDGIDEQRKQVDNARKDTNLKEFQEVQLRAAGALDEKLPAEAREQLQIAALHQLRGFLRGDYGESFKRPAFELLLAGHAAAVHRIGVPEVQAQLSGKSRAQISEAVVALTKKLTPIDRTRMLIIRDEAAHIFTPDFPLDGRRFDLLDLSEKTFPEMLDLSSSHFFGANLYGAKLQGVILYDAHLENAYMWGAELNDTHLSDAHLESANLSHANLAKADLSGAHLNLALLYQATLEGTNIAYAQIQGADMRSDHLERANYFDAIFDNATILLNDWENISTELRETAQQKLIKCGAIHADDLKSSANSDPVIAELS